MQGDTKNKSHTSVNSCLRTEDLHHLYSSPRRISGHCRGGMRNLINFYSEDTKARAHLGAFRLDLADEG